MKTNFSFVVLLTGLLMNVNLAFATTPCIPPEKSWFLENVVTKSDFVVRAKINDFSNLDGSSLENTKWTKIKILENLRGNLSLNQEVLISDWQATDGMFFSYEKGQELLFWLKKDRSKYYITSLSWDYCIPGIWKISGDKAVNIGQEPHSLNEIKKLLKENLK